MMDNQAASYSNDVISGDCGLNATLEGNSKKVLVASRHMRNDSKGIQLEFR